jgi:hypothetical protein
VGIPFLLGIPFGDTRGKKKYQGGEVQQALCHRRHRENPERRSGRGTPALRIDFKKVIFNKQK